MKKAIRILRSSPGVFSFSFLVKRKRPWIKFHLACLRIALFSGLKEFFITCGKFFSWYFIFSWLNIQHFYSNRKFYFQEIKKSDFRILLDLIYLAVGLLIPPRNYFVMKLYLVDRSQWIEKIFDHEVPNWQKVLSGHISEASLEFINSKLTFQILGNEFKIPTIETKQVIIIDNDFDVNLLDLSAPKFIKLDVSYKGLGAFVLQRNSLDKLELVHEFNGEKVKGKLKIEGHLKTHYLNQKFIVQPLLKNAQSLREIFRVDKLVFIKVFSSFINEIKVIHADIYVPIREKFNIAFPVNIETGRILEQYHSPLLIDVREEYKGSKNQRIPEWDQIKKIAKDCHLACPELKLQVVDVAITERGIKCLEINLNPSLENFQLNRKLNISEFL